MKHTILRVITLVILVALLPGKEAIAQTVLTNPTSPFTVPAGVTQIKVEVWGGGGAGGGTSGASFGSNYGSGGGGGAYNTTTMSVSSGQSYTIIIGSGGSGVSNAAGNPGTASSVSGPGGTITANPGLGGARNGGTAGTGGSGIFNGGNGATGGNAAGGGGGGGAGSGGAGGNGANGIGGSGGTGGNGNPNVVPYKGGAGANAQGSTNSNGSTGTAPGGGGSGANTIFSGTARTGGNGAAGQVVITYCPTYSLTSMTAVTPRCVTNANSTVTLNGNLPVGTYTVTYNRSSPAATGLAATMNVTTANTGTFVATGLTTVGNTTITVTNIASTASSFCTNVISANNTALVVISGAATVDAGIDQTACTAVNVTLNGSFGGTATSATWSGGTGTFNPDNTTLSAVYTPSASEITAGSATLTLTTNNPVGACNAVSDAMTITIKKAPTAISISPASSTICVGNSQALTATATIGSTGVLASDNFNGSSPYVFANTGTNSGGGTAFSAQSSGYTAGLTTITNNDASQFMIGVASAFGNASTNSTLTSAVLNTVPYGTLSLGFRHTYQKGSEAGVSVQVSTNGGSTWSNISTAGAIIATNTFTTNQGANNNFVSQTINLGSFINNANFRLRFNFVSNVTLATSWWAIDDVTINGVPFPVFSWTASTGAGINGLPGGAGTSSVANKNITVNPTATTTYTLTATDIVTNCGLSTQTAIVNVNQNSTISLSSAAGTNAQTICLSGSITDITYAIGGGGTGASISAGSLPAGLTASYNAGVFTISGTPTEFGNFSYTVTTAGPCVNVSLSGTLTVNTAPQLTCPANQVTTTDAGFCLANRSYDLAVATGFPAPTVSYIIDGNFISFPYDFPLGTTTVQVLAEGACAPDANCSFTVTVNDLEGPAPDLAVLPTATGECSVTVTDIPTATDACDGPVLGTTTDPLTYTTQGTHTITWTFTDLKGNITTQAQTVILNDITPPVINCPATQTFCTATGNSYTIPVAVASDNCTVSAVSYAITGATTRTGSGTNASGLFNPGISTITWTVTDANNNTNTCATSVNIQVPLLIPAVTGVGNVCPYLGTGDQLTYTAFSFGADSYTWTLPPNVNLVSGAGTAAITVTFNNGFASQANKQLRLTASNTCGTSPMAIYYLLTQFPNTPGTMTASIANVCSLIGTTNTATYSIKPVVAATGYAWSIPPGTEVTHPNPIGGINDTIVYIKFNNDFATGQVSVTATNGCGVSSARSLTVQRTPPTTPGLINGPTNVCSNILPSGSAATYTIAAVPYATGYTWSLPVNAVVTHPNGAGPNDTTITVQFPAGFTSGSVSVSAGNGCSTSGLRSLVVNKLNPATPSVIDVIQVGFCGDPGGRVYTYTLSSMPANATTVQWTVPTGQGATLVSGQNSSSITVSYPVTAVNGSVTAQSVNNCANSTVRSTPVKLPACPSGFARGTKEGSKSVYAETVVPAGMEVKLFPNPTVSDFNLQVATAGNEKINIRILDMQGRELKKTTMMPYQTITIGAELKTGSYMIEIVQGKNKVVQKLVKF